MKTRGLGPHSRPHRLAALDGRTLEAKLFDEYRSRLLEHVGAPSITQAALIERACWVHLRCCLLDAKIATGDLTDMDSRQYLAWVNTERRILGQLGLRPAAAEPVDPMERLRQHFASSAREREAQDVEDDEAA